MVALAAPFCHPSCRARLQLKVPGSSPAAREERGARRCLRTLTYYHAAALATALAARRAAQAICGVGVGEVK